MRLPVDNSLVAKLTTSLRFNSLEMMLWTWVTAQFLEERYYEKMLRAKVIEKDDLFAQKQIQTEVIPAFINSTELIITSAFLTKMSTTGFEFPRTTEESKPQESVPDMNQYDLQQRTNTAFPKIKTELTGIKERNGYDNDSFEKLLVRIESQDKFVIELVAMHLNLDLRVLRDLVEYTR